MDPAGRNTVDRLQAGTQWTLQAGTQWTLQADGDCIPEYKNACVTAWLKEHDLSQDLELYGFGQPIGLDRDTQWLALVSPLG